VGRNLLFSVQSISHGIHGCQRDYEAVCGQGITAKHIFFVWPGELHIAHAQEERDSVS